MGPRGRGFGGGPFGFGFMGNCEPAGPGFKWRFYDRGDLKFVILRLLRDKPMHGYEVMRALEEDSAGWYKASAGSVYPTLQMLEDQGYIVARETDGKKVYHITEAGGAYLTENSDVLDDILNRVSDFTSGEFRTHMGALTRSFMRLSQATFERAMKWPGDEDVVTQIKVILDKAAHDIEGVRAKTSNSKS